MAPCKDCTSCSRGKVSTDGKPARTNFISNDAKSIDQRDKVTIADKGLLVLNSLWGGHTFYHSSLLQIKPNTRGVISQVICSLASSTWIQYFVWPRKWKFASHFDVSTWYVIALWFNSCWKVSVFGNGMSIVIKWRKFGQDLSMPGH